jgi:hypothetical protein
MNQWLKHNLLYLADGTERVVRTFLAAFLSSLLASGFGTPGVDLVSNADKAAFAGLAAAVTLVISLLSKDIGDPQSAGALKGLLVKKQQTQAKPVAQPPSGAGAPA